MKSMASSEKKLNNIVAVHVAMALVNHPDILSPQGEQFRKNLKEVTGTIDKEDPEYKPILAASAKILSGKADADAEGTPDKGGGKGRAASSNKQPPKRQRKSS